jgi:hypothetical protein
MTRGGMHQVEIFCDNIQSKSGIHVGIHGYVVRLEERLDKGFLTANTLKIHAGHDTLPTLMREIQTVVQNRGIPLVKN